MIYVLYGLEEYLIKEEIKKIINKNNIEDIDINTYDLENTKLEDIIEDSSTISLFSNNKLIIVENAYIFTGTTNKKLIEQDTNILEKYINNQNENTILIFTIYKEKLDERKKIVKLLKDKKCILEFNKPNNIIEYIKNEFDNYKISNENINLLINRVGDNLYILHQEINKLKQYKDNDLNITKEDIMNVCVKNVDVDIFNLIENIVSGNKEKALESYFEMIKLGEEAIKIIVMLSNQFRLMYQARNLYKKGYSEKDISSILDIHPYRIKLAITKSNNITDNMLLKYIDELYTLDSNITTGKIDKDVSL